MNTNKETIIGSEGFVEKNCGENNCRSDDRDDYHCHDESAPQSTGGMMVSKMFEQFNFYIGLKELHEKMIEEREKGR